MIKKNTILLILILVIGSTLHAQDIKGTWNGVLMIPQGSLRVDFHIEKSDSGYSATMDSPDQSAYGIEVSAVEFADKKVKITVTNLGIVYSGELKKDNLIEGTFTQMGQSFDMDLKRKTDE